MRLKIKRILFELEQLVKEEENKNSSSKILLPRQIDERKKKLIAITYKRIQRYIENGSEGDLDLISSPITYLPDNLKSVGGDLKLSNSKILKLPDNLMILQSLFLQHTSITSLPDNLYVCNHLNLSNSSITSLPDDLYVGSLNLNYSDIKFLPNNLRIERNLYLEDTPLSKIYSAKEIFQMIKDKGGEIKAEYCIYI